MRQLIPLYNAYYPNYEMKEVENKNIYVGGKWENLCNYR